MPSSIFNSEDYTRKTPTGKWKRLAGLSFSLAIVFILAWEVFWRGKGYHATINDNKELWVITREKVNQNPKATVIIGASRILFGFNLKTWEKVFQEKPIQLATVGTNSTIYLDDLANNSEFAGTLLMEVTPSLFFVREGKPYEIPSKNVRGLKDFTYAQRWGHYIGRPFDKNFAFLEQDDLPLKKLLEMLPLPERKGVPNFPIPPFFHEVDEDRQAMMSKRVETDPVFSQRLKDIWKVYFTPPALPKEMTAEQFEKKMAQHMVNVLNEVRQNVKKIQDRGGKVVFIRYPASGTVLELENKYTPKEKVWTRIVTETKPNFAIHYDEHESLKHFLCPDESHLNREDAVKFTEGLITIAKAHFL